MLSTRRQGFITACLLVLVLVPVAACLSITHWLPPLAAQIAAHYNLQVNTFTVQAISIHHINLSALHISNGQFQLQAEQLELSWNWPDLSTGQLDTLQIGKLKLTALASPAQPEASNNPAADIEQLWALPISAVQVARFSLNSPQIKLNGQLTLNRQQLSITAHLPKPLAQAPALHHFHLEYPRGQHARLTLFSDTHQVLGYIQVDPVTEPAPFTASLDLKAMTAGLLPQDTNYALAHLSGQLKFTRQLQLQALLNLRMASARGQISGQQGFSARATDLTLLTDGQWSLQPVLPNNLKLHTPIKVSLSQSARLVPNQPVQLHLTLAPIQISQAQSSVNTTASELKLQWLPAGQVIKAMLELPELKVQYNKQNMFAAAQFRGQYQLAHQRVEINSHLQLKKPALALNGNFKGLLKAPAWFNYQWQLEPLAADQLNTLTLPGQPLNWQLTQGSLYHAGQFSWQAGHWQVHHQQRLENLSGQWQNSQWRNLTLTSQAHATDQTDWHIRGQLHIQQLDIGFPLRRTELDFRLQPMAESLLNISHAQTELLGGRAQLSQPLTLDKNFNGQTLLTLERISLAQTVALQQTDELTASGYLYGQLPLTFNAGIPSVTAGQLRAEKGIIRYRPLSPLTGQAQLDKALAALNNFRYAPLEARIRYQEDGELKIRARLQGYNPDWRRGRPVDFTLNLEDNLNQLLRALRYSDTINQRIEQHYQGR